MKYNVNFKIKGQKTDLELETLKAIELKKYPKLIQGLSPLDPKDFEIMGKIFFEKSNIESKGFVFEDIYKAKQSNISQSFTKKIFGEEQTVEVNENEDGTLGCLFYDLNGVEFKNTAEEAVGLITTKYSNFTKNGSVKNPNERQAESFLIGVSKILKDCIKNDLKEEDYLEKFSPYTLFTLYLSLVGPDEEKKA